MKITKIHIVKFRGFKDENINLGSQITAIAGQNGTQKSTLLGIITQTFTINKNDPMRKEKPLCGGNYISAFKDKFRLSPDFDKPKEHEWTMSFDRDIEDFTVESIKRSGSPYVRFWRKGSRKAGDGYLSFPTIFLSLKRLIPTAEENKIKTETLLTPEELDEFKKLHNKILITQTPISSAIAITSKNKQSLGVSTSLYDWNQNSMGQDNLGKIILALFSFQRLKNEYKQQYKGGILAIDELDATMYPASQVELLKVLRKYASKLCLQIVFTTHSISLLKAVVSLKDELSKKPETADQVKIAFLKKYDDNIKIEQDVDLKSIILNLNVISENKKTDKITVYTEDNENILFAKSILGGKVKYLNFVKVTMSCSFLIELVSKKVPAFMLPHSIVILDGDVKNNRSYSRNEKKFNNVLLLPGKKSPERMIADFLYGLSDADELWGKIGKGYSKQVCFREYSLEQINASGDQGRKDAKKWFNIQLRYWSRNCKMVLKRFFDSVENEVNEFNLKFDDLLKKIGYV